MKEKLKHFLILILSIIFSILIDIPFIFLILNIVGNYYESIHPTVIGEDDLGYGIMMMFWLVIISIGTIPLVIVSTIFFRKTIFKILSED